MGRANSRRISTDAEFTLAVSCSTSVSGVIRELNKSMSGSASKATRARIERLGLDISHFRRGGQPPGSRLRVTDDDVLVLGPPRKRKAARILRRALLGIGRDHSCEGCGNLGVWQGKDLVLEIDHISGQPNDNRRENLRFLCPNCHSLTETFGNRSVSNVCLDCDIQISRNASRCVSCSLPARSVFFKTKIDWPATSELEQMVAKTSCTEVAKLLHVSGRAVRKRLTSRGVLTTTRDLKAAHRGYKRRKSRAKVPPADWAG
jgi:hypothetical protein